MKRPALSACLIVGDTHVGVLARCLKSLLNAPGGPACDELVIGFNGLDDPAFTEAVATALVKDWGLAEYEYLNALNTGVPITAGPIRLVLHRQKWVEDFSAARNENFSKSSGSWAYYVDADDLFVGADHPAFLDSLEVDPPKAAVESYPVKGSLVDYFAALPAHVNVVLAPYNYVSTDKGRPVIRKRRPRAVRWSEGHFVWTSEVHEVIVSAFGREVPIWAPGFVLVHAPVVAEEARYVRNSEIRDKQVERLKTEGYVLPATLVYAQAIGLMQAHHFAEASEGFEAAARSKDAGVEDRAYYLLMAARCAMEAEDHERAGRMAVSVIDCNPARPEGYLSASEASFRLNEFAKCTAWYEASKGKRLPPAAMVDDRFERCLRPVAYAGIAYLRSGKFREAAEVADIALKEGSDPVASKVKSEAEERLKRQVVAEHATGLAESLVAMGYLMTARRVLGAVESFDDFLQTRRRIEERLGADAPEIAADTEPMVGAWLAEPGVAGVTVPVDAAEDPEVLLAETVGGVPDGVVCRFAAFDPQRGDSFASSARADGIEAERILRMAEQHGDVEALSLADGAKSSYLLAEVRRRRGAPNPRVPDVTFFCPVFAEPWGPWRILKDGTGGSEESVVYLARELQSRGYAVDVYAPLDVSRHRGVHVEGGVRWRTIDSFDPVKRVLGATIAHRSPWAIRFQAFDPKRLFVWHQDARYNVGWNAAIAMSVRNLWVSKWQRGELLRAAGINVEAHSMLDTTGAVVGNGIPQSAIDAPFQPRRPFSCVYTSSPLRGLAQLVELWPFVRSSFPEATLRVYYGWETLRGWGGMAKQQQEQLQAIRDTRGVEHVGRVPQFALERELTGFSQWTYPCMFPEGYCVAGVRAAAAGLVPVYIRNAALPEVQYPSPYSVPQKDWGQGGSGEYASALLQALQDEKDGKITDAVRQGYRDWARRWTWDHCVSAVEAEFRRSGVFGKAEDAA